MTSLPENVIPLGTWLLCRPMLPVTMTQRGLWLPPGWDKDSRSEGVAEVVRVGPGKILDDGTVVPHGISPGDRVIYRGFLRFAWQIGDLLGAEKATDFFVIDSYDVLAVIEGSGGTIGFHNEFVL